MHGRWLQTPREGGREEEGWLWSSPGPMCEALARSPAAVRQIYGPAGYPLPATRSACGRPAQGRKVLRILRIIGFLLAGVVGLLILVAFGARFHDGPVGLFPGGPLDAGPLEAGPVADWSFAQAENTIELQLLSQQRSRTTWILVHDGAAFIPCAIGFPPGKTWHQYAAQDGRAVLRIEGRRYPVTLQRVEDPETSAALAAVVKEKYGRSPRSDSGVWYFRVTPRAT